MRAKSAVLLMLALGCGVVASIGITQVMAKRGADTGTSQAEMEGIFVAIKDIAMGDPISAQMVKLEQWPKDKVPKGAITKLEDIENRRPRTRIFSGSPILENQLLGKGVVEQGASDTIPKGFRVVAVKADSVSGSGSLIRPGDRVDVLVHIRQSGGDLNRTVTKTILQDVKVFAVNDIWDVAAASGDKSIVAKTISLLVTPAQAEKITMASEIGVIRLVMRSPTDKEQAPVSGTRAQDVLGGDVGGQDRQAGMAGPAPAEAKLAPVAGLLAFLNARKQKPDEEPFESSTPSEPKVPVTFTVRILAGSEMIDTVLESTGSGPTEGSDTSFLHWRVSSSSSSSPGPTALPKPAPKPSTHEPPQDEAPPQDPEQPPKK